MSLYAQPPSPDELYHDGRPGTKWGVHLFGKWDKRARYADGKDDPDKKPKAAAHDWYKHKYGSFKNQADSGAEAKARYTKQLTSAISRVKSKRQKRQNYVASEDYQSARAQLGKISKTVLDLQEKRLDHITQNAEKYMAKYQQKLSDPNYTEHPVAKGIAVAGGAVAGAAGSLAVSKAIRAGFDAVRKMEVEAISAANSQALVIDKGMNPLVNRFLTARKIVHLPLSAMSGGLLAYNNATSYDRARSRYDVYRQESSKNDSITGSIEQLLDRGRKKLNHSAIPSIQAYAWTYGDELYHTGRPGMSWYKHKYGDYDERAKYAQFISAPKTAIRGRIQKLKENTPGFKGATRLSKRNRNWGIAREQYNLKQIREEQGEAAYRKAKSTREYAAGTARRLTKRLQDLNDDIDEIDKLIIEQTAEARKNDSAANQAARQRELHLSKMNLDLAEARKIIDLHKSTWEEEVEARQERINEHREKGKLKLSNNIQDLYKDIRSLTPDMLVRSLYHKARAKQEQEALDKYMKKHVNKSLDSLIEGSDRAYVDAAKAEASAPAYTAKAKEASDNVKALNETRRNLAAQREAVSEALDKTMHMVYSSSRELNEDIENTLNKALSAPVDATVMSNYESSKLVTFGKPAQITAKGVKSDVEKENKKKNNGDNGSKSDDSSDNAPPTPPAPTPPSGGLKSSPSPEKPSATTGDSADRTGSKDLDASDKKTESSGNSNRGSTKEPAFNTMAFPYTGKVENKRLTGAAEELSKLLSTVESVEDAPKSVKEEIYRLQYKAYGSIK